MWKVYSDGVLDVSVHDISSDWTTFSNLEEVADCLHFGEVIAAYTKNAIRNDRRKHSVVSMSIVDQFRSGDDGLIVGTGMPRSDWSIKIFLGIYRCVYNR